jgi:hypothetical protein
MTSYASTSALASFALHHSITLEFSVHEAATKAAKTGDSTLDIVFSLVYA